jgi:rRNA-processing protein FCF1
MASDRVRCGKTKINVLLDTSMILSLFEYSFDLEYELTRLLGSCNILVPSAVIKELEFLSKRSSNKAMDASAALKLISRYNVVDSDELNTDEAIIKIASKKNRGFVVATNDKKLRSTLKKKGLPVVTLRKKRILYLDE